MSFFQDDDEGEEETTPDDEGAPEAPPAAVAAPEEDDAPAANLPDPRADVAGPPVADDVKQQRIKDYLAQQYGQAADSSGVDDARSEAKHDRMVASLGEALEGAFKARSMAYGGAGVDSGFYQKMRDQANSQITQAQQARQARVQEFLQKNELQRQSTSDSRADQEFSQKQKGWAHENEEIDPNSATSASVRRAYGQMFPDAVKGFGDDFEHLSAADIKAHLTNPLELKTRMEANKQVALTRAQAHADKSAELRQGKEIAATAKADKDLDARFDKMTTAIHGTVRDSVGDEKKKLRSATHAKAILDGQDLDNLTPEQANEIGAAMAATLAQGSPAESLIHNMTPQSAHKDLAKALEYVTGAPQGAGLGDQLKMYQHMLDRQIGTSTDIIAGELAPTIQNFSDLAKKDPQKFNAVMAEAGLQLGKDGRLMAYQPSYSRSKGSPTDEPKGSSSGTAVAGPAPKEGDEKPIGGVTYVKVKGGWKKK